MPEQQYNKLIERLNSDSSATTKEITYFGEIEDFTQFTIMTGFSDGVNAVAQHGFGKQHIIPNYGLAGLDIFAYGVMYHLAQLREGKFRERNALLNDQNPSEYYQEMADALFATLTEEEVVELIRDKARARQLRMETSDFIIQLLKYNASCLNSKNLPAARTTLNKWAAIFEQAKKRSRFAQLRYPEFDIKPDQTFREFEIAAVKNILNEYSEYNCSVQDTEYFIACLTYIEKHHSNEKVIQHQINLLRHYGVLSDNLVKARTALNQFYTQVHNKQDKNDKAFYKANMRGIQAFEHQRTLFKINLFHGVKVASGLALAYSAGTFITSIAFEIMGKQALPLQYLIAPLLMVGTTSLLDEWSDLFWYKLPKYYQAKQDLEKWEAAHSTEGMLDFSKFGLDSQAMKRQEHQELKDRLARRYTKAVQAGFSFSGVFLGVLISFTIAGFVIAEQTLANLDMTHFINPFSFAGFGTIGLAAIAGVIMVAYQMGQNENKKIQAMDKQHREIDTLLLSYPGFGTYEPQEFKSTHERRKFQY
jgi:hypothetical protein